jgi:transcriptional regulator with XRE-family HTH domain
MLTSSQIRAARALLRWSAYELASRSEMSSRTIQRMEADEGIPSANAQTLHRVQITLENAGIEFIDENGGGPGVRLRDKPKD